MSELQPLQSRVAPGSTNQVVEDVFQLLKVFPQYVSHFFSVCVVSDELVQFDLHNVIVKRLVEQLRRVRYPVCKHTFVFLKDMDVSLFFDGLELGFHLFGAHVVGLRDVQIVNVINSV